jgi:hypothetical protein
VGEKKGWEKLIMEIMMKRLILGVSVDVNSVEPRWLCPIARLIYRHGRVPIDQPLGVLIRSPEL